MTVLISLFSKCAHRRSDNDPRCLINSYGTRNTIEWAGVQAFRSVDMARFFRNTGVCISNIFPRRGLSNINMHMLGRQSALLSTFLKMGQIKQIQFSTGEKSLGYNITPDVCSTVFQPQPSLISHTDTRSSLTTILISSL